MGKRRLALGMGILLMSANAFATGDAGCGLGSVIFQKNTLVSQLSAATTNGSFGSQTFGMTSGTSNCKTNGFASLDKKEIYYAEANYDHLVVEMAKGKGENLSAFAQVLGCTDSSVPTFGKMTQERYEKIFPTQKTTPSEMLQHVKQELNEHPVLAKECGHIG
jgi:hypothetical protein